MKSLLITGVSKGIGAFLAQHYVKAGYKVFGISRTQPNFEHENFVWYKVDVASEADCLDFFRKLRQQKVELYGLVNNAAIATLNPLSTTPYSTAENILQVNVLGSFLMMREASKLMVRAQNGRIINFTSVAKPLQIEWESVYSASKAAIESLTKTAAREFGAMGVTVNAVGPGPVSTDLLKGVGHERIQYVLDRQALQKMTEYEDVLNVVDFFLSESSHMVTGQVLYLGGAG